LLGPNGAGKSTTFKMMCGLLRPSEGAALVDGLDLYQAPSAARARLGYMAQEILALRRPHCRQNLNLRRCLWLLGRAPARGDRTRGGGFRPCHT
jgi:ABC-2 type transport system ATP-binding protein